MSVHVMSCVWQAKLSTADKMVLLVIADHASDDGTNAWPSQATIAEKASMSVRSVQRSINSLVAAGYLTVHKHAGGTASTREDRRPHLYTIRLERLRGDSVSTRGRRGDTGDANGATTTTITGRQMRPMKHPLEPSLETPFDAFWNAYPRKVAKRAAEAAWQKAIREASADEIVAGARRFANDPNRHPSFTPHPATWLNHGRWADDPLPARPVSAEDRLAAERAAVAAREAKERERQEALRRAREQELAQAAPMPADFRLRAGIGRRNP